MYVCAHLHREAQSWCSPSPIWVPGIELKSSAGGGHLLSSSATSSALELRFELNSILITVCFFLERAQTGCIWTFIGIAFSRCSKTYVIAALWTEISSFWFPSFLMVMSSIPEPLFTGLKGSLEVVLRAAVHLSSMKTLQVWTFYHTSLQCMQYHGCLGPLWQHNIKGGSAAHSSQLPH